MLPWGALSCAATKGNLNNLAASRSRCSQFVALGACRIELAQLPRSCAPSAIVGLLRTVLRPSAKTSGGIGDHRLFVDALFDGATLASSLTAGFARIASNAARRVPPIDGGLPVRRGMGTRYEGVPGS